MASNYRYFRYPMVLGIFQDFSGGEYGLIGGKRAAPNQFTGQNVLPYRDGGIGPRAGVVKLAFSPAPSSGLRDIGWTMRTNTPQFIGPGDNFGRIWTIDGANPTNVRHGALNGTSHLDNSTAISMVAYGGSPLASQISGPVHWNTYNDHSYVTTTNSTMYGIAHEADTIAAVAGSPSGYNVCVYQDRMVIAGIVGNQNRLRFSAANDYVTWPASNYLDLPDQGPIICIVPLRDHLLVVQSDMTHWVITGFLGVNEVVRQGTQWSEVVFGYGFNKVGNDARRVNRTNAGDAWGSTYLPRYPVHYSGVGATVLDHLQLGGNTAANGADEAQMVALAMANDFAIVGGTNGAGTLCAAAFVRGTWSLHQITAPINSSTAPTVTAACPGPGGSVLWGDPNSANAWCWVPATMGPPGFAEANGALTAGFMPVFDFHDSTNGAFRCFFTTSEVYFPHDWELITRFVDVRYTDYNTGTGSVCTFDVYLNHIDVRDDVSDSIKGPNQAGAPNTVYLAKSGGEPASVRRRIVVPFAESRSGGFSVTIDNLRNCRIDKILVLSGIPEDPRMG